MSKTASSESSVHQIKLCSKCFKNHGLILMASRIGKELERTCPQCEELDGRKLDVEQCKNLAYRFFVVGSFHRVQYGGAPIIQMNEYHYGKSEISVSDSLELDIRILEEATNMGFFYYGPREWMVGHTEPLEALQDKKQRSDIIQCIIDSYPRLTIDRDHYFYRLRKNLNEPQKSNEYDSPPDSFLGRYRFDSPNFPVLYGSPDLEVCFHECLVSVEDEIYIATLRPKRTLQLLNLTEVLQEDGDEFESVDISVNLLFLAGAHSYEISRDIAIAAKAEGLDGFVYPSYYSTLRTGRLPVETVYGVSLRKLKGQESHARSQTIPNLALFGRPVKNGDVSVECVNRFILTKVLYDGEFGPLLQ